MRFRLVIEAITPIAHFDTRTGVDNSTNVRLFMTQPILHNGRLVYAPHVSENALRSTIFRVPLANHLVEKLDVAGKLPRGVLNLIYAGGSMGGADRAPGDETAIGHAVGKLYPSLSLLGGAVAAFILPRSKLKMCAFLLAKEYAGAVEAIFPEHVDRAQQTSAFDLVGDETRTRGTGDEASGNQMLYSYQALAAGAQIAIEITLDRWADEATIAAAGRALAQWEGFVGGQGRQGRGRCRVVWSEGLPEPGAYDAHFEANADAMREGLISGALGAAKPLCAA